jgi:hypothetical protein
MAAVDADNLEFCTNCVMLIANGEVFDSDGNDITDEINARQVNIWGSGINGAMGLVLDMPDDGGEYEPWFAWTRCTGCGSDLAGNRFKGAHLVS